MKYAASGDKSHASPHRSRLKTHDKEIEKIARSSERNDAGDGGSQAARANGGPAFASRDLNAQWELAKQAGRNIFFIFFTRRYEAGERLNREKKA